ncbi:MAG: alpha/beta hydrolase, partial [Propionibacteriaceae bacterium]|nr:alpha/beta hydrolase [Propionibacteriaceae bacterium]
MRNTYVLVHGSWHSSWAWEPVAWALREQGNRVVTPALPGSMRLAGRAGINHSHYVAAVVDEITRLDLRQVILVGHSFAGSVIAPVWQVIPDRIQRLVFHTAFVIADGQSVSDNVPPEQKKKAMASAAESPDGTTLVSWDLFRSKFMQDAPEDVARL